MLEHDELLPEEQAHPALVQELQTMYQMEPREKLILAHVHERLVRQSATSVETIKDRKPARAQRSVAPTSFTGRRAKKAPQRWQRVGSLVAVLLVALLIVSLSVTLTSLHRSGSVATGGNTISLILIPAEKGVVLSPDELDVSSQILLRRLNNLGLADVSVQATTSNGQSAIQVQMAHFGGNEQQTLNTLLASGVVEFWDTGHSGMNVGATFDPGQYTQYNSGTKPGFTGSELNPNSPMVGTDSVTGQFLISFSMLGDAIPRFQQYTADRVGDFLTITLDRKVLMSAIINTAISGEVQIFGNFTQQQANAIVAILKSGALPVALRPEK